jgi:2-dehydropantoate 2-reductase
MTSKTITIFGAGAIGSWLAARLAHAGNSVSVVARGAHRDAMLAHGLTLNSGDTTLHARPQVAEPAAIGPQDVVFLTVKAPALAAAAQQMQPLLGPNTIVVPALNGVPWWFFEGWTGPLAGVRLTSLDPEGSLARALPIERIIGCVVYPGVTIAEPGVVQHSVGHRVVIGEPTVATSARIENLAGIMNAAGFETPVTADIRQEIWLKLWGNMNVNPASMLTGARIGQLTADPDVRAFLLSTMDEAQAICSALGIVFPMSREARMAVTERLAAVKTSMLQDLERGRMIELDAILGSVVEIGTRLDVPIPGLRALLGMARVKAMLAGVYPPRADA